MTLYDLWGYVFMAFLAGMAAWHYFRARFFESLKTVYDDLMAHGSTHPAKIAERTGLALWRVWNALEWLEHYRFVISHLERGGPERGYYDKRVYQLRR